MRLRLHSTRLSGALALALLLIVSFAGRLHEALVPHVLCPEHGEAVELAHGVALPAVHQRHGHAPETVVAPAERETSHEHCDIALLGKAKELLDTRHQPAQLVAHESHETNERPAASAVLAVPLLLLAPKHSPPVA